MRLLALFLIITFLGVSTLHAIPETMQFQGLLTDEFGGPGTALNLPTGYLPSSLVVTDFDGDLAIDLATVNRSGNNLSLILGSDDGTFQEQQPFLV